MELYSVMKNDGSGDVELDASSFTCGLSIGYTF